MVAPNQLPKLARQVLARQGWYAFRDVWLSQNILAAAALLGEPVCAPGLPIVGILKPKDREQAHPNTTSALYGCDAFPLHTDMAHWPLPPRYLVMRARTVVPGFPTIMVDSQRLKLNAVMREQWHRASWSVSRVQNPFLCSMFFDYQGKCGFRWDICTMSPYGDLATKIAPEVLAILGNLLDEDAIPMDWQSTEDILIIDNWRMVHMRPSIPDFAKARTLERVLVKEADE